MSHTTTYAQVVTDIKAFLKKAAELGHKVRTAEAGETIKVQQYGQNWVDDAVAEVHFKGWRFPVAVKANGELMLDHWGSAAETMQHLGNTLQEYNHELINKNINMTEVNEYYSTQYDDGRIVVTLRY